VSLKLSVTTAVILAVLAGPTLAGEYGRDATTSGARQTSKVVRSSGSYAMDPYGGARASYGRSYAFEGWPTDYLVNRFGDRQAQGR
jgi:hypothetical protein